MIRGVFLSEQERTRLRSLARRQTVKHGIARQANALVLLDDGMNCEEVARVLPIDDDTVRAWHKANAEQRPGSVSRFDWKGSRSRLSAEQEAELVATLSALFFTSTAAVIAHISSNYGIDYSRAGGIKLLHRLGFEYSKPKGLPARADVVAQEAFVAEYERLLNRLEPDEAVYFADAVHPEWQSRPAHGWIRRGDRVAVKRGKGRMRLNLHGALNLETLDGRLVETVKMSMQTTIDLFENLERANPQKRAIYVVLDNAPVNRGHEVRTWLDGLDAASRRSTCPPTPLISTRSSGCGRSCTSTSPTTGTIRPSGTSPRRSGASSRRLCRKNGNQSATASTITSTSSDPTIFGFPGSVGKMV
jgi:transposase